MMKHPLYLFGACLLLAACSNPNHEESQKQELHDTLAVDTTTTVEQDLSDATEISLPSPLRIAGTFKRSGLKFIESNLHSVDDKKNYSSNYSKAINMGVYSADMAYCLLNKQYQLSKTYLKTTKELGADLGLSSAYETGNLAQRFENNLGKEDSLLKLVSNLQMLTDDLLEKNKQNHVSALIFTGAWIETLHSAAKVYLDGDAKTASVILEQLSFSGDVIKVLKQYTSTEKNIENLIQKIEAVHNDFSNIPEIKISDLNDVDFTSLKIDAGVMKALCEKIESLRKEIISA